MTAGYNLTCEASGVTFAKNIPYYETKKPIISYFYDDVVKTLDKETQDQIYNACIHAADMLAYAEEFSEWPFAFLSLEFEDVEIED